MEYTFEFDYDEETGLCIIDYATQEDIDSFTIPKGTRHLHIMGDYIDRIVVPDGIETVVACKLGLKEICIPDSVKALYCNDNFIKHIELPSSIEVAEIKNNLLQTLCFRSEPTDIGTLKLSDNSRLRRLDFVFPECLEVLKLKRCYGLEYIHPSFKNTLASQDIDPLSAMATWCQAARP